MRCLGVLLAGLFGSCVIADAATADRLSDSRLCQKIEQRLGWCLYDPWLSIETRASCDRIEQGFRALCGPREAIQATASADGAALNLLRHDYLVSPIEAAIGGVLPTYLVIGPPDLDDPDVIARLRAAHEVGKTVAIANATEDEARSFHRLVRAGQEVNCAAPEGQTEIELYGLQQSVTRTPPQSSSFCLLSLDERAAGAADRRWLRDRFGPTPPQPAAGQVGLEDSSASLSGLATNSTAFVSELAKRWLGGRPARAQTTSDQFLTDLASETHCSFKGTDPSSPSQGSVEWDVYTYAMRDFTDTGCGSCQNPGADYYLVQDDVTFAPEPAPNSAAAPDFAPTSFAPIEAQSGLPILTGVAGLEFTDPQSVTTYESSYTNSQGATATGSVGFSAMGPNVTLGGSVTTSDSTTYSVPPVVIQNISYPPQLQPEWNFLPQSSITDLDVFPTWTWYVPQDAYPSGGTGSGQISFTTLAIWGDPEVLFRGTCNVTYPFSAWTVAPPQLSSLDPMSVEIGGGQFTITGQYLYPGSITAVLIGGTPISLSSNVELVDDTTIVVAVPMGLPAGTFPVQVNTQFNGEDRFSNTMDLTLTD